jgi:putative aldouronate transport system substrate-binding protein
MKKALLILISAMLALALLAGCITQDTGGQTNRQGSGDDQKQIITCRYVLPGSAPTDIDVVEPMINEAMQKAGVNVELKREYIPWEAWEQKTNMYLSTGEVFDLLNVMNDIIPISSYVSRGALADITDIMNQYGSNILATNPDIMMDAVKVNNRIYGIPAFWVEFSHSPEMTIRLDILRKYNLPVPKNMEELTETFEIVMSKWEGPEKPYIPIIGAQTTKFGLAQKGYDSWPFWVYDNFIYVNQHGMVANYFETEEFKQDCKWARLWYQKGLIHPDVLVFKSDQLNAQLDSGNWFIHAGTIGSIDNIKKNYPDIAVDDFAFLNFNPEKPNLRPYGTRNMNAVPKSSKNPEAGVMFINWLYANQENYDLYMYGREDIDYEKTGARTRKVLLKEGQSVPAYFADDWMIGNIKYLRTSETTPTATIEMLYTIDTTAVNSIAASFTYDASDVMAELANVRTEIQASIAPIACGVVDYETELPKALEKLKAAGMDKVINEYKTQFEAFRKK